MRGATTAQSWVARAFSYAAMNASGVAAPRCGGKAVATMRPRLLPDMALWSGAPVAITHLPSSHPFYTPESEGRRGKRLLKTRDEYSPQISMPAARRRPVVLATIAVGALAFLFLASAAEAERAQTQFVAGGYPTASASFSGPGAFSIPLNKDVQIADARFTVTGAFAAATSDVLDPEINGTTNAYFGGEFDTADFNGDGWADLAVGAPG